VRVSGLASGLALAVRPAGLAEVSRVNGAPQARPAPAGCGAPLRLEGPARTMRGVPSPVRSQGFAPGSEDIFCLAGFAAVDANYRVQN
jgi:hypothetical protein